MDTNKDGTAYHSGMLLDHDRGTGQGWSLEGNYGDEVQVVRKDVSVRYMKIGFITQWK